MKIEVIRQENAADVRSVCFMELSGISVRTAVDEPFQYGFARNRCEWLTIIDIFNAIQEGIRDKLLME